MLSQTKVDSDKNRADLIRVMFYNVENLFDTFDDPSTNDDEFTPKGNKRWNHYRYREKLNNLAKTIIAAGEWNPPEIIGLSEVENFQVLLDLTTQTPLKKYEYQIVHENSPDTRGIDNALLYLPQKVKKTKHEAISTSNGYFISRDILYTTLILLESDTLQLYINHWPSRYGGKEFSDDKRISAAKILKANVKSLQKQNQDAKILIMGDFNDEPADESITQVLGAIAAQKQLEKTQLYNISMSDFKAGKGTLVYKEIDHTWFLFDQMIVSGTLLDGNGIQTYGMKNNIFDAAWLLKDDRPYRSYQGPIYIGGFSDHLPIFLDLYWKD